MNNKQTNNVSTFAKTNQAVLKEVPPHTARELGEAEAECEKEGQPEVVGGHLDAIRVNFSSKCHKLCPSCSS